MISAELIVQLFEYLIEAINKDVDMRFRQGESGPDAQCFLSTPTAVDPFLVHVCNHFISQCSSGQIKSTVCPPTAGSTRKSGVSLLNVFETGYQPFACTLHLFQKVVPLDHLDDAPQEDHLGRVTYPGVENAEWLIRSIWGSVEEAADQHLLAEGDQVWRGIKSPVFVSPDLASWSAAGLNLQEIDE